MNQNILTKIIEIPSKGKNMYPSTHPLYSGEIELRYPTARDEDILSDSSLIKNNTVIDKFVENIIVNPEAKKEYQEGNVYSFDKDAIAFHARILAYGPEYTPGVTCPKCGEQHDHYNIDLSDLPFKEVSLENDSNDKLVVELPVSKKVVEFRFTMVKDERNNLLAEKRLKELKIKSNSGVVTTLLKNNIIAVDGNTDKSFISNAVDEMLSRDSLFLRNYILDNTPGIDFRFYFECESCGESEYLIIPMTASFFWPQFG